MVASGATRSDLVQLSDVPGTLYGQQLLEGNAGLLFVNPRTFVLDSDQLPKVMVQLELPAFSLDDWSYPGILSRIQRCLGDFALVARDGDAAMLEWLKWEQAPDIPEECREHHEDAVCTIAAAYGYLDTLKYARSLEMPLPWSHLTTAAAALFGRLSVLQWLRRPEHVPGPCHWDECCTTFAASRGDQQMLEWLRSKQHEEPCPWGPKLCSSAIKHGHLDMLHWARAQQPPVRWDWYSCNAAAELGDLKALRWLRPGSLPAWLLVQSARIDGKDSAMYI
ncbi:hypothetical protein WJX84_003072 [Apatococcus fuscideae]|uniref:Ankyrin repeat domain-containing protein n=1 Tax=Apatococcus fuscideae TaxID=2026836 RepID=A0AAW1TD94_9CHLO